MDRFASVSDSSTLSMGGVSLYRRSAGSVLSLHRRIRRLLHPSIHNFRSYPRNLLRASVVRMVRVRSDGSGVSCFTMTGSRSRLPCVHGSHASIKAVFQFTDKRFKVSKQFLNSSDSFWESGGGVPEPIVRFERVGASEALSK